MAQLYRLHADGATIVLNRLHALHPPLSELCAALETEFSAPFQANVYLSPPRAQGFKAHFDTHDVFVLQLHGTKKWRIYRTPIVLPLAGQAEDIAAEDLGAPLREINLEAGDTLYVPRGVVHDAVSQEGASMHATVGVLSYTWADAMLESLAALVVKEADFRRALPRDFCREEGFDAAALRARFRELAKRFSDAAEIDASLETFREQLVDGRRPFLRGQVLQLALAEKLDMDSVVVRRPYLAYRTHEDADSIRVRCFGKEISLPKSMGGAVRYVLATPRFAVRDVPSTGAESDKLVLVRRFVREGLLAVADRA